MDLARHLAHVYSIELPPGTDVEEAARAYAADPHVVWASVDSTRVLDEVARDPFLTSNGSWGQPYADMWGHDRIRAQEAWELGRGEGAVVAVVDTGLDWLHPDIAENVWVNPGEDLDGNGRVDDGDWNGIDDDGNGFIDDLVGFDFANSIDGNQDGDYLDAEDSSDSDPFDDNGHGTHVAGIIAAVAGNGEGIAGVAPSARIMALKGFKADGENSDALLWRAVLYAALNGADVINNSWSCGAPCPRNPLAEEVVELVHALGVVIVTSAGNKTRDVAAFSPENMWQTLTVGSSDVFDEPSGFTNQGFGVDVFAPGGAPEDTPGVLVPRRNILSLRSSASDPDQDAFVVGDRYLRWAGTSMSAPQVAGAVALLRAQRPWLGPDQIRRMLRWSALDLQTPGHDHATGAGLLDARALLEEPDPPDLLLRIDSPRVAAWFDPNEADVVLHGTISGRDLRQYVVRVGLGEQPSSWVEVARSNLAVEDGEIATWELEGVQSGAWVIEVEAEAFDGRLAYEYIPVSLERLGFEVLSSDGPAAERPAISGRSVVWQSRRGLVEDDFGRYDQDLYRNEFGGEAEQSLLVRAGNQMQPSVSRGRSGLTVAWLDQAPDTLDTSAYACLMRSGSPGCEPIALAERQSVTTAPVALRDRLFWLDDSSGDRDVRACRWNSRGSACLPFATGLEPARRSGLGGDGRRTLVWSLSSQRSAIATCQLDRRGHCREKISMPTARAFTRPAGSGDLIAWVDARFSGDRPLLVCVIEADGACEPIEVVPHVDGAQLRVSGDVVVWEGQTGDQGLDVFFCEFDRLRNRCPVQRLTSEMSSQKDADIDARRIVWIDERFGPGRVLGATLPGWRPIAPQRARVGRTMHVLAWLDDGGRGPASVVAERIGPSDIAEPLEAVAIGRRRSRQPVWLSWCPGDADLGEHVVTLEAETRDGLTARASFSVQVEPASSSKGARRRCRSLARDLHVDAHRR